MPHRVDLTIAHTWDGAPLGAGERVRVRLGRGARALRIAVVAPFHADAPPAGPPRAVDGLWEHEVVEVFVAAAQGDAETWRYTEIELSPWGHHLVLQLHGVRRRVAERLPLRFRARRRGGSWCGAASIDLALLPPLPWRVAAFALHGARDARRYLSAPPLPGSRPDFHQPHRFLPFTG